MILCVESFIATILCDILIWSKFWMIPLTKTYTSNHHNICASNIPSIYIYIYQPFSVKKFKFMGCCLQHPIFTWWINIHMFIKALLKSFFNVYRFANCHWTICYRIFLKNFFLIVLFWSTASWSSTICCQTHDKTSFAKISPPHSLIRTWLAAI